MLCWWVHVLLDYYNAIDSRKARVPCDAIGMGTIGVGAPFDDRRGCDSYDRHAKLDSASLM